jgi:ADP-heptose:LPS heptosyltransferase
MRGLYKQILYRLVGLYLKIRKEKIRFKSSGARILFISTPGLGNAILSLPLVKALETTFKDSKIDVLVGDGASREIFAATGICKSVFTWPRSIDKQIRMLWHLRKYKYDISLLAFPTLSIPVTLIPFWINSQFNFSHDYSLIYPEFTRLEKLFDEICFIDPLLHDIEQNLQLINHITDSNASGVYPEIHLSPANIEFANSFFSKARLYQKTCIFHPGSKKGTDYKRWPMENYIELGTRLKEHKYSSIVILGPEENELKDDFERNGFILLQSKNILDILAVIERCDYFISNDSGIMHLASLVPIRIFTLWGGTSEQRNSARSPNVINIKNPGFACQPCVIFKFSKPCKYKTFPCLTDLDVDKVLQEILDFDPIKNRGER